jgi:hypothetical protein
VVWATGYDEAAALLAPLIEHMGNSDRICVWGEINFSQPSAEIYRLWQTMIVVAKNIALRRAI